MLDDLMQFLVILAVSTVLLVVVGKWIAHFFSSPNHSLMERGTYRLLGVNPEEKMSWKRYGLALLLSNAAMLLLGYVLLRVQGWIPETACSVPHKRQTWPLTRPCPLRPIPIGRRIRANPVCPTFPKWRPSPF